MKSCWCLWSILLLRAILGIITKGCVGVHGLCCCLNPYWCPWPVLWPLRAMMVSVVCALAEGCVHVCGLYWHQRPCEYPRSTLSPETVRKSMIHAPANGKGKGSDFFHDQGSQFRKRDIEGFCDNLYLQPAHTHFWKVKTDMKQCYLTPEKQVIIQL